MIYLIHGPDSVSARTFLLNLKKNYPSHTVFSGKKQSASTLQIQQEGSLFGEKQLVIIENFIPNEKEALPKVENIDIVLLTGEIISPPSWIDKSWLFKQAETLANFKLVDQTISGYETQALLTLTKLLKQKTPPELIVGSFVRQFRLLSFYLTGDLESVSRSAFVLKKTKDQAKNWSISKVKKALLLVLKADFEIKNGLANSDSVLMFLVNKIAKLVAN